MTTIEIERVKTEREKFEPLYPELLDAADYIREHGWTQGILGEHGGPRCLMGAVASAATDYFRFFALLTRAAGSLPYEWNDVPERTQDEVIDFLERTAWFGA